MGCGRRPGGLGPAFRGCVRGASACHWAGWVCRGARGSSRRVCAGCWMWGVVRGVRQKGLWPACVVVRAVGEARVAGPGAARDGGPVWVAGWGVGREGQERGLRGVGWGWVRVCRVGVWFRLQRRVCVVTCRPGSLEEKLAVLCGRGKDFADERAYLVHLLVSGGKRVL